MFLLFLATKEKIKKVHRAVKRTLHHFDASALAPHRIFRSAIHKNHR